MKILNRSVNNVCIIGDIHASPKSLKSVLAQASARGIHKFISLGDLWDRGTDPNETVEIIYDLLDRGQLDIILGNHDWKFIRHLQGQKVSIKEEQIETLSKITPRSTEIFNDIFYDLPVAIYDPAKKIFISHAAGGRPADILGRDFQKSKEHNFASYESYFNDTADKKVDKKYVANLLYGITNGEQTENGRPVRLPLTENVDDDLEGWTYIFGHIHASNLYPEGNKRVVCVDWCSGEPGGSLAGLIIGDDATIKEENLIFSNE